MAGEEFESLPGEGPNPFESPRPWRNKFGAQCRDDLAELRNLIDAGRRQEAISLLRQLPMWHFVQIGQRRELAERSLELGYPALAGRWWYLEEHKTPEMLAACREFELSCGENPLLIYEALGEWIDAPPESYAQRRFTELQSQSIEVRRRHTEQAPLARPWKHRILEIGCFLFFVAIVVIFIVGVAAIAAMFYGEGPWRL